MNSFYYYRVDNIYHNDIRKKVQILLMLAYIHHILNGTFGNEIKKYNNQVFIQYFNICNSKKGDRKSKF